MKKIVLIFALLSNLKCNQRDLHAEFKNDLNKNNDELKAYIKKTYIDTKEFRALVVSIINNGINRMIKDDIESTCDKRYEDEIKYNKYEEAQSNRLSCFKNHKITNDDFNKAVKYVENTLENSVDCVITSFVRHHYAQDLFRKHLSDYIESIFKEELNKIKEKYREN